ncbi:MAG: peptide chain release factor 2 [Rhodobacteraceae bacterium]|nr:peptide chain release factor 2 [Paracoccaceae bacterium]
MKSETMTDIRTIERSLQLVSERLNRKTADERLANLRRRAQAPDLWDDPESARKVMQALQRLGDEVAAFDSLRDECEDIVELVELGEEENDDELLSEAESALSKLVGKVRRLEIETLLGGEADRNDAFLEIKSGAGGTESCDWVLILARMYERWAQKRGYELETIHENRDAEAGLRAKTVKVSGKHAYGWLKTESGVHRLVRISPFDSSSRRHTSFSTVSVTPVVDDAVNVEINPSEIRVDTFRAAGAGGQHVNKTDSAVRMTHLPTGIVVTSSLRSQHRNRDLCLQALKSQLYEQEMERRSALLRESHLSKGDAGWGNQIRSYVLAPYQLVKDLRTRYETSDTQGVLDGDIDRFMAEALAKGVTGLSRAEAAGSLADRNRQ